MRLILSLFIASLLFASLLFACGNDPYQGPGGQCPGCGGSPAPTSAPNNGLACATTPPSTIPFYQALMQPGLTQKGNNTCIPKHEYTEIAFDGSFCTTTCALTSPPPVSDPPFTLGQYYINLYADFCEDGTSFTAGLCNEALEANYPFNVLGLGYFNNGAATTLGASKAMKYVNPNILHANEQIAPVFNPDIRACTKPGTGIKFYGTPTNPSPPQNPAGMLGDDSTQAAADLDIEHDGVQTTTAHRIYVTDNNSCKNPSPATPTPVQNYMGYLGSTHLQNWMASLESGASVNSVCAFGAAATCTGPNGSGVFADVYFMYENDQSTTSILNQTQCNNTPCNPSGSITTTQHWASDQAMVNDRVALFNAYLHEHGSDCENGGNCIPNGTGIAQQFNGLTNFITTANSCYLYMGAATGNYGSSNTLQGEFEQATSGFNNRLIEPREISSILNCTSDVLANTNGMLFFNDHQQLQSTYQFYYMATALKMLAYKAGYISSELRLDDTPGCSANCNPNLTVYPAQMLVPDPTANGSPVMAKFAPPANVHGRDSNGYDGGACNTQCGSTGTANAQNDGSPGNGCGQFDASTDHGAADLLAASLSHTFGAAGCTGAGFASYAITGCPANAYAMDYKCNPAAIYVREFANMYYNGAPITSAPISSAANYMAFVVNQSEVTYQVQCTDLPLEGGANYGHIVTATPATPTQNGMDMVNGGSLTATTAFACGTASANLPAESAFWLVK